MNKKLFSIALVLGLFCSNMKAQVEDFEIGIKIGLNIADFKGEETDELDPRQSIHVGLAAEFPVNEYMGIQPELLYSFQGFKGESFEPNFMEENFKADYILVPIMVKYYPFYVVPGLSLDIGPQIGILMSSVIQRKNIFEGGVTETSDVDAKEFTSAVDIAANFGFGYQLEMGAFVQVRYNLGITDVFDQSGVQHSVFQFSTGVKF